MIVYLVRLISALNIAEGNFVICVPIVAIYREDNAYAAAEGIPIDGGFKL